MTLRIAIRYIIFGVRVEEYVGKEDLAVNPPPEVTLNVLLVTFFFQLTVLMMIQKLYLIVSVEVPENFPNILN